MKRVVLSAIGVCMAVFPFPPSAGAAGGAFWSDYNVPDPGCITIGDEQVCGPVKVDRIEIIEESTADILGECPFGDSNMGTTGSIPPGYQFWCERSKQADGSTDITVSSNQANLPLIKAYLVRESDGLPMWETYNQPVGGLHGAGNAVYADPYQHKEFEFAGYKKLTFVTSANKDYNWMRQHALLPLRNAGYTANLHSFSATSPGFIAEIGVYDTLDGRALLEDDVILKESWKIRGSETRGNRGTYEYSVKYRGTATAVLYWPAPFRNKKVWEITAEVTFEKNEAASNEDKDVYITSTGTLTQTMYTGTPMCPGPTFTDTYPIFVGDGQLHIRRPSDPAQYRAGASISALTPVQEHTYTWCCFGTCEEQTLTRGEQEHQWLYTGDSDQTAAADGTLQGAFSDATLGSYEWNLSPVDTGATGSNMPAIQSLLLGN